MTMKYIEDVYRLLCQKNERGFTRKQIAEALGTNKVMVGHCFRKLLSDGIIWPLYRGECPVSKRWSTFYTGSVAVRDLIASKNIAWEEHRANCRVCGRPLTCEDKMHEGRICNECYRKLTTKRTEKEAIERNAKRFPDIEGEEWRQIADCKPGYRVSNMGRVKNPRGKIYEPNKTKQGYLWVRLDGRAFGIHRLVATAFVDNPQNKPVVNHKDCVKSNNHIENLEWVTQRENILHAFSMGAMFINEKQLARIRRGYKLTKEQVIEIRARSIRGESGKSLAERFGVSPGHISRVINRKSRAWILDIEETELTGKLFE